MLEAFDDLCTDGEKVKEEDDILEEISCKYEEACEQYQLVKANIIHIMKDNIHLDCRPALKMWNKIKIEIKSF